MTNEQKKIAAGIILAVRSRGSDAETLRDAAHEACHGFQVEKLTSNWERESIHEALQLAARTKHYKQYMTILEHGYEVALLMFEIEARAVEQVVCAALGSDEAKDIEHWAMIAALEAIKNSRIAVPSTDWLVNKIKTCMHTATTKKMADRIIALGSFLEDQEQAFKPPRELPKAKVVRRKR